MTLERINQLFGLLSSGGSGPESRRVVARRYLVRRADGG